MGEGSTEKATTRLRESAWPKNKQHWKERMILGENRIRLLCLLPLTLLTACGEAHFDTGESISMVLPTFVQHSGETQTKTANEIERGECGEGCQTVINSCLYTRDQIRVAEEGLK